MYRTLVTTAIKIVHITNETLPVYDAQSEFKQVEEYATVDVVTTVPASPFTNLKNEFKKTEEIKSFNYTDSALASVRFNFMGTNHHENLALFKKALLTDESTDLFSLNDIGKAGSSATTVLRDARSAGRIVGSTILVNLNITKTIEIESQIIKTFPIKVTKFTNEKEFRKNEK